MFSKKSLIILATALLSVLAAPVDNSIVNELRQASTSEINALASVLTNGINGVIHLVQDSNKDQSAVLNNYVVSVSQAADSIKQAKSSLPPQLEGALTSLNSFVSNYKAPNNARSVYDPHALSTHQGGAIGNSEGTQMAAPLANDINGLLQSHSAAGSIYHAFDSVDQMADGAVNAIGSFLAPITLGGSKAITDFLTGPVVQTLTHGSYDTIAHLIGSPIDRMAGMSELSPADQAMVNQAHANAQQAHVNAQYVKGQSVRGQYVKGQAQHHY